MEQFNTNKFRIQPDSTSSASAGQILTFTLPENATIHLPSVVFSLDVATSGVVGSLYGKLPADASSLIHSMEVYASGVQIQSGTPEYNTISRCMKIVRTSRDRDGSVDGALHHGQITTDDALDNVSILFKPYCGFFGEASTKYIDTSLLGTLTIRLTLATSAVLAFKEHLTAMSLNLSSGAQTLAAQASYQITNATCLVETVSFGPMYTRLLQERLAKEPYLSIAFKNYHLFNNHGTTSTAHDMRFSLSASSIDAFYCLFREGSYQTPGVRTRQYQGALFTDANLANFFNFKSFNSDNKTNGTLRYQWQVNAVSHPQHRATVLEACHDLTMLTAQSSMGGTGNMVTSLTHYQNGNFVIPLILNVPSAGPGTMTGFNSRGGNSTFNISIQGQVVPTANAASQTTGQISTTIVAETTSELRISSGKSILVVT
jgi:hypothetical protein